ncbi:argininosuccinate lyase [Candidatus Poribacteria bacterium]|nr:argininosuccinate lyase [Candidatus Poribacteria bacterium]
MKLWGGRFSKDLSAEAESFTETIDVDSRMVLYDIWGSQAHAIMLAHQQIISQDDLCQIVTWLEKAKEDFLNGKLVLKSDLEDVHMNVEAYLIEGAGREYGGKLHTARSRNDQVLVDARLYIREQILDTQELLYQLAKTFLEIATANVETVMPGYTHTQHAQPITLGFWATAYVSMFLRDLKRLDAAYSNVNTNPLGACALAGTSFPTERNLTTKLLGFDSTHEHALDVISSRDFITETLFALAQLMSNLSRLSEEIVYWSTYEFRMVAVDDAYASGSSIMPQKKNPCIAELARGRTGKIYSALQEVLITLKSLPMGYNRDLQEDKPPLWEAFDVVQACLSIFNGMLATLEINTERMAELANANFATATELANFLVRERGLSFRECHEIVGSIVGKLASSGLTFSNLQETQKLLKERNIEISIPELRAILDPKLAVLNNKSLGGASPGEVKRMAAEFDAHLAQFESKIAQKREQINLAQKLTNDVIEAALSGVDIITVTPKFT